MKIRHIQQLFLVCLMSLLLPGGVFATTMYADDFAAPQKQSTRAVSALETTSIGTHFLLLDKTWKSGSSRTFDVRTYEFLHLFTDNLKSNATGSKRVARYNNHRSYTDNAQLRALVINLGRMHKAIDNYIIFTGKTTNANKSPGGGPSDILGQNNAVATTATAYNFAAVPVPEPVTFMLLATGIIGLMLLNRRSKHTDIQV